MLFLESRSLPGDIPAMLAFCRAIQGVAKVRSIGILERPFKVADKWQLMSVPLFHSFDTNSFDGA